MVATRLRILFSEDHQDTVEMTRYLLDLEGFDVICPDTSNDIVRLAKEERFDAYLLDNWTPGLSGIEICKRIREFDTTTPIVFYSAAVYSGDKEQAIAAGAQAYLAKPASIDELIETIRSVLLRT
jgi:DNA-binding response OmpR family regulator